MGASGLEETSAGLENCGGAFSSQLHVVLDNERAVKTEFAFGELNYGTSRLRSPIDGLLDYHGIVRNGL